MVYGVGLHTRYFNGERWAEGIPDRVLRRIADQTGGGYFELKKTDDLNSTFTRVEQELHSQYLISYSPNNKMEAGWHDIRVDLLDRAGRPRRDVKVRQRPGYWMAAVPE